MRSAGGTFAKKVVYSSTGASDVWPSRVRTRKKGRGDAWSCVWIVESWQRGRRGFIQSMRDHNTHLIRIECVLGGLPLAVDLPCGLGGEGGEREPVEVLVLFEVRECDHEEAIEHLGRLVVDDALPDLVGDPVEKRILVCVLEVLDGVEVLE